MTDALPDDIKKHTFVFVAGLHRSGTTLLARILAAHPDFSGLKGTKTFMGEGAPLIPRIPHEHGVGAMAFKRGTHLTEASQYATAEMRDYVWDAWRPFWDTSKHFLVEKSPSHLMRLRLFQALFPNSKIIIIVRHPIAQTMAISKWALGKKLLQHLLNWHICHNQLLRDLPYLRNVHILSFEALCAQPEQEVDRLFSFLGPGRKGVETPKMKSTNLKYYKMWSSERTKLKDRAVKALVRLFYGSGLKQRFGYAYAEPLEAQPDDLQRALQSHIST